MSRWSDQHRINKRMRRLEALAKPPLMIVHGAPLDLEHELSIGKVGMLRGQNEMPRTREPRP